MKNIKIVAIVFMLFIGSIFVNGQSQIPSNFMGLCGCCDSILPMEEMQNSCTNQSSLYSNNDLWLPTNNDEIKYVKVNFIFLHKQNDGLGNFVSGDQEHEAIIDSLVSQINYVYSTLHNPNDPNCHVNEGFISDTRIRIVANIIHHTDPYYWNNENEPSNFCSTAWLNPLDEQIVNDPSNEKGINIYFTENETEFNNLVVYHTTQEEPEKIIACSCSPSTNDFTYSSIIHMPGVFSKYYWMKNYAPAVFDEPWNPTIRKWFIHSVGNQIAHELGHSFNLHHVLSCRYNLMSKNPANSYFEESLTPDQIGEIHRYLSISSIRKYTTDESYLSTPHYITSDAEWDLNFTSYRDVIVEHEATLTVSCKLVMKSNAKIVIKQNAKLIVDGGIITTEDSKQWPGIEVWGNSSQDQQSLYGQCAQGVLELKNGAIIENAKCAVELWRPGHWSTTGGIVHASDATFRNNTVAVHALCYRNFNPGSNMEVAYNGHFDNCSFIINGNYIGTETFEKHVVLADVNGIVFQGCDFSADRSVSGVHQWCMGISAYDAGFLVNSSCFSSTRPCPEEDIDRSTFTGFCSGIRASSDGNHPRSFSVSKAIFTNNDHGIHATNINFPIILNSEFNIGRGEYCDYNYGICFNNVTGFTIEENYFHPSSQSNATTVGIAIYHSNGINDVYHNTFENLSRANLALGQNIVGTNSVSHGAAQGLTYTCNDNTGNQRDFMVLVRDGVGAIQQQQGSSAMPAGNTFRNSGFQFYNEGTQQIEYYYNSNETDETPNPSLLYRVNPHGTTNSNPCYSHYGNGPVRKSASEKAALESDYLSAYNAFLNLKQLYENSIDGGNTATQVADINNAIPADMWQLRAQLLGLSPFVSGEVLTTAAERHDVFTDPVLFEILAANPDELKNDSLITYLESKTYPMPDYMINLLRQIASGVTSRTALVAQMGKYGHDYALAAGDIVRSNLNDTISNPTELRNWLGNMNDIAADRMAISSYLHEGDSVSAFALANMLPELYGLQGDALADYGDYMRLLGLYQTLKSSQRTVYEMTEAEIMTVDDIAEMGTGVSKSMAESLMAEITGNNRAGCFAPDMPDLEEGGTGRGINTESSLNKALGFSVNVTPNPATTWVTVDYTLPVKAAKATLTITNTIGVNVLSTELEGTQGSMVLDLRGLTAGVYMYMIRCGEHVLVEKLVITK